MITSSTRSTAASSTTISPSTARPRVRHSHAVRVKIEYCELGNCLKPARDLVRALRREFPSIDLAPELAPSSGGVFEVSVNGHLVFSKKATRRLPEKDEIFYHVGVAVACGAR